MPTPLRRRVTRETTSDERRNQIVVTLAPGDVIEFRNKGGRTVYTAPIDWVMQKVIERNVEAAGQILNGTRRGKRIKRGLL